MIAKIGAFWNSFLCLKLSYFCDKHLISFENNTFSQILIFHTALLYIGVDLLRPYMSNDMRENISDQTIIIYWAANEHDLHNME